MIPNRVSFFASFGGTYDNSFSYSARYVAHFFSFPLFLAVSSCLMWEIRGVRKRDNISFSFCAIFFTSSLSAAEKGREGKGRKGQFLNERRKSRLKETRKRKKRGEIIKPLFYISPSLSLFLPVPVMGKLEIRDGKRHELINKHVVSPFFFPYFSS